MFITILDFENKRTIVGEVPESLIHAKPKDHDDEVIALAIIDALGLPVDNTQYMVGDFNVQLQLSVINSDYGSTLHKLAELTQDFEADALEAMNNYLD